MLPDFPTISIAVTAANSGDTIKVCPGTYAENVNDGGKALTFLGAQAGNDARTRATGSESTVDGGGGTAFTLSGGSTLDGFTITGATTNSVTPGVTLSASGEAVSNTIFNGDSSASIILSDHATFTQNVVVAPASGGYGFFFNSGGGTDSSVTDNAFSGNLGSGAVNVADPSSAGTATGAGAEADSLTITDNTADTSAGGNFAVLGGTTNVSILRNTVTGSASSGTGILLLGDDSGFTIEQNRISGIDASAVSLATGYGYADNGNGTIDQNSFLNNRRGINVTSDTGTIEAIFNILVGNTANGTTSSPNAAIRNVTTTSTVNASPNFYGCNTGPNTTGCDAVLGPVNDAAWLVLSTSIPTHQLPVGGSTTLTADLLHDNNGATYTCTATTPCTVLDGQPITFAFDKGTVNPASTTLVNSQASTLVQKNAPGTGTVTATVDNAVSSQTVTDQPAPTVPTVTTISQAANQGAVKISVAARPTKSGPVTGYVTLYDSTSGSPTYLCELALVNGAATVPGTCLPPGTYALTAAYEGTSKFIPSNSGNPKSITVAQATPRVTQAITKGGSPSDKVTVQRPASGASEFPAPMGNISIYVTDTSGGNSQNVCMTVTLNAAGSATCSLKALTPGNYLVYAVYGGETYYKAVTVGPVAFTRTK